MIDNALANIKEALEESFANEFENVSDKIALCNIINPDGSMPNDLDGKIVFLLVNVAQEMAVKNNFNSTTNKHKKNSNTAPAVHLNLNVLFCANFTGNTYMEGLAYLSAIIRFFQRNPIMKPPSVGKSKEDSKLFFEMVKLDYSEMSHLWSAIGSKLMPSVLYKVRLLSFSADAMGQTAPSIMKSVRIEDS